MLQPKIVEIKNTKKLPYFVEPPLVFDAATQKSIKEKSTKSKNDCQLWKFQEYFMIFQGFGLNDDKVQVT